jgi:hypothetical protein
MLTYCIPAALLADYPALPVVARAEDAAALERLLNAPPALEQLTALRWPAAQSFPDAISRRCEGLPIDLWLADPGRDYPRLYQHLRLAERHPLRVSLPAAAGCEAAARLAAALHWPLLLYLEPAAAETIGELERILEFYLGHAGVDQPVEPFHSLFLGFLRHTPLNLWALQQADPSQMRWITEAGEERPPGRLRVEPLAALEPLAARLRAHPDCLACAYQPACQGFLKWPDPAYSCAAWLPLWARLREAAQELRADLAAAEQAHGG